MPFADPRMSDREHFDVVVVRSGFGSTFFVRRLLANTNDRVLILEWGRHHPYDWQWQKQRNSEIDVSETYRSMSEKPWNYTTALGGGTNCWYAQTPRFHPSDFKLRSLYGVGTDWPITHEDLERDYCDADPPIAKNHIGELATAGDQQSEAMEASPREAYGGEAAGISFYLSSATRSRTGIRCGAEN